MPSTPRALGDALTTLVLQPGSTFQRTRSGLDVGRRTYHCLTTSLASLIPAYDTADGVYTGMYITGVESRDIENGVSEVNVAYGGLMTGATKDATFDVSFIKERRNFPIANQNPITAETIAGWYYTLMMRPVITASYVSTVQPVTAQIGERITPPGITGVTGALKIAIPGFSVIPEFIKDQGWVLMDRAYQKAGPIYGVTDVYEWCYTADQAYAVAVA